MGGYWEERAAQAQQRKEQLLAFGMHARGVLATTRHGLFAVDPEDGGVGASLLHCGCYAEEEIDFAASLVSAESDVLIVGTHLGALLVPMTRKCASVVGIEANPHTFELLQANVRLNDCRNVELHNVAASDTDGDTIEFLLNRENSGGSKRKPITGGDGYTYDHPEVVRMTTARVDTIARNRRFDLVIMDIEGSELFALRGMPNVLRTCRALAVEFRPHHLIEVAGGTIEDLIPTLLPYFNSLHVPTVGWFAGKTEIAAMMRTMFDAGECHDVIYLFKDESAPPAT